MFRKISHSEMGKGEHGGWLKSTYHFSFARYFNPENVNFGVLRVLNDDLVGPGRGFDPHPHNDMEIVTYVIDGELTHGDSMGNERTLGRGEVQYMSAGSGITHSEYNRGKDTLRLLQLWILPDQEGYPPRYGELRPDWEERRNRWLHLVSSEGGNAPVKVHQDVNISAAWIVQGNPLDLVVRPGRQAYLVVIEGQAQIGDLVLEQRDALEIREESTTIEAGAQTHLLLVEMALDPVSG